MKELTCIGCPIGCALKAELRDGEIIVSGNGCIRGKRYAMDELTCPKRMLTTTVALEGGTIARLSVRTAQAVPKAALNDCLTEIRRLKIAAPVAIGDVLLPNCAGTGVDIIATKSVAAR